MPKPKIQRPPKETDLLSSTAVGRALGGTTKPKIQQPPKPPSPSPTDWLSSTAVRAALGGTTNMTLWRWEHDPVIAFPPPDAVMNGRKYWQRRTITKFQDRMQRLKAKSAWARGKAEPGWRKNVAAQVAP
jgi:hypothetical protein